MASVRYPQGSTPSRRTWSSAARRRQSSSTRRHSAPWPGGKIGHAELRIGDSMLFLADEFPEHGACAPAAGTSSPVTVHLYVNDCDKVFNQAVAAGAKATMPPMDMFWG